MILKTRTNNALFLSGNQAYLLTQPLNFMTVTFEDVQHLKLANLDDCFLCRYNNCFVSVKENNFHDSIYLPVLFNQNCVLYIHSFTIDYILYHKFMLYAKQTLKLPSIPKTIKIKMLNYYCPFIKNKIKDIITCENKEDFLIYRINM